MIISSSVQDRKDSYYRKAKREGYSSRAAYKLKELVAKYRILGKGDTILELGCSPGGWTQVALEIVGPSGRVVGVDVADMKMARAENFIFVQGDVKDSETLKRAFTALNGPCNAVISDLSPHLTGIKPRDEAATKEMLEAGWSVARKTLKNGGNILFKVFPSRDLEPILKEIRSCFRSSFLTRPSATRRASSEFYLTGKGFQG